MSRLEEVAARLGHEPCCEHRGSDETGNCWDCRNTGCAHPPYAEGQAEADLTALLRFARDVAVSIDSVDTETNEAQQAWLVDEIRAALNRLEKP